MKGPVENKIHRLQWIQMTLSGKRRITTQELIDHFGIGKTTAKSDLDFFKQNGSIRWSAEDCCYLLVNELKPLPGLFISQKEWLVFMFTDLMLRSHASAFSPDMKKFQERYRKEMSKALPVHNLDRYFSVSVAKAEEIDPAVFETCVYGVVRQAVLTFAYHKPIDDTIEERTASPYHLLNENGRWLMISWDHHKKAFRNFMPSRIKKISLEIAEDFQLRSLTELQVHTEGSYGIFKGEKAFNAVMLFSERKSVWAAQQKWHADEKKEWEGKKLKLTIPVSSVEAIMEEALCHGPDLEILGPPIVREAVKERVKRMLENYEKK